MAFVKRTLVPNERVFWHRLMLRTSFPGHIASLIKGKMDFMIDGSVEIISPALFTYSYQEAEGKQSKPCHTGVALPQELPVGRFFTTKY